MAKQIVRLRASLLGIIITVLLVNTVICARNGVENPKTILMWKPYNCSDCSPNHRFGTGNEVFVKQSCEYQNCYIQTTTGNLSDIEDTSGFDAILFNGRPILKLKGSELPQTRNSRQYYVFVQLESADRFPVCHHRFDDFFNWTMTHRLDSDVPWPYFTVQNALNKTVGPKPEEIKWGNDMGEIDGELKKRLMGKKKLAAWFVSYCKDRSGRLNFTTELNRILQSKYNEAVDIYGECGPHRCPKSESERCQAMIRDDYLFYLSFENSFSKDYVTEKLLTGLLNSAIPVVLGEVDYNRYVPPGSYLNALSLGPEPLADTMMDLFLHRTRSFEYFRWTNHYHYTNELAPPVCQLCAKLNRSNERKRYKQFRQWWNMDYFNRCPECKKGRHHGHKYSRRNCLKSSEIEKGDRRLQLDYLRENIRNRN